mgnify:CR=1 FL=1
MIVTILRHGTTDLNGKGLIATKLDYSLNDNGKKQCIENIFAKNDFSTVYSSPYKRTLETARLVYPYSEPIIVPCIVQRDLGILNEKYKKDYTREYLKLVREYIVNPEGAETLNDIMIRLDCFFDYVRLNSSDDDNVLVVTHNGIMRIIKKYYMNETNNIESENLGKFTLTLKK